LPSPDASSDWFSSTVRARWRRYPRDGQQIAVGCQRGRPARFLHQRQAGGTRARGGGQIGFKPRVGLIAQAAEQVDLEGGEADLRAVAVGAGRAAVAATMLPVPVAAMVGRLARVARYCARAATLATAARRSRLLASICAITFCRRGSGSCCARQARRRRLARGQAAPCGH
jgi:hypothetical protein